MKKAMMISSMLLATGCSQQAVEPQVSMANPASEYCLAQGGKLEMKKDAQGNEYALCHLPNGQVIEEWEYFRQNH